MASGYDAKKKAAAAAKKKATSIAQSAAAEKRAASAGRDRAAAASAAGGRGGSRPASQKKVTGFGNGPMGYLPGKNDTASSTKLGSSTPASPTSTPPKPMKPTDNGRSNMKKPTPSADKPKPTPSASSSRAAAPAVSKPKAKPLAAGGGSRGAISQSDTRWVKKPGQAGFVQQISTGKKVTGKVALVADTTKGKAGQVRTYSKGADVTKAKKK